MNERRKIDAGAACYFAKAAMAMGAAIEDFERMSWLLLRGELNQYTIRQNKENLGKVLRHLKMAESCFEDDA